MTLILKLFDEILKEYTPSFQTLDKTFIQKQINLSNKSPEELMTLLDVKKSFSIH